MRLLAIVLVCALAACWPAPQALAQSPEPTTGILATPPGYWPVNGDMECSERGAQEGFNGTVPGGWTGVRINTATNPNVESALFAFGGMNCANDSRGIEKMEGGDSWTFKAPDLEETAQPGKPFDVAMFQQVPAVPGASYTLSGWMVSLCGGSAKPNDCPPDQYIAKMLGIDPTGGTNPLAPSVQWVENRQPHVDAYGNRIGWQNLRVAAIAQGSLITVFVRVNSPFQHHGNHAFVDALRLVRSPVAGFTALPGSTTGRQFTVSWAGGLGPDVPNLPPYPYTLYFDVQYKLGSTGNWVDWLVNQGAGSALFAAPDPGSKLQYYFRVLPHAEQPSDLHGLWPSIPGVATQAVVRAAWPPPGPPQGYLPLLKR